MRPLPLTGANSIPIKLDSNLKSAHSNLNSSLTFPPPYENHNFGNNSGDHFWKESASAQRVPLFNPLGPSLVGRSPGPIPPSSIPIICARCLGHGHAEAHCSGRPRCRICLAIDHFSGNCNSIPRLSRPSFRHSGSAPSPLQSLPSGPADPRRFTSFGDLFKFFTGINPHPPIIVPWRRGTWSISAPEFDDGDEVTEATASPELSTVTPPSPAVFSNFGEFASSILGLPRKPLVHVFWEEKTPVASVSSLSLQSEMAYRLVDLEPFMPLGAQRRVVQGRPVMRRVVIGHVAEQNNDVAIVNLNPILVGPMNFMAIHNIIEDFLH